MIHEYTVVSGNISLRPLIESDIENVRLLRNRDEIRKWFAYSEIITKENQKNWFKKYLNLENDIMVVAEETMFPGKFIGLAALYNIDHHKGSAEFGRLMVDKRAVHNPCTGFDIVTGVCRIAFDLLALDHIYLKVMPHNTKALSLYERVGFRRFSEYDEKLMLGMAMYRTKIDFE